MRTPVDPFCEPGPERADLVDDPAVMARVRVAALLAGPFLPSCRLFANGFLPRCDSDSAACRLAHSVFLVTFGFAHTLVLQESDVVEQETAALGEADLACGQ